MTNGIEGSTDFGGLISSFLGGTVSDTVSGTVSGKDAEILRNSIKKIEEISREIFGNGKGNGKGNGDGDVKKERRKAVNTQISTKDQKNVMSDKEIGE